VKKTTNIVIFCASINAVLSEPALAAVPDIYKSVYENGLVTFSDATASSSTESSIVKPNLTNLIPELNLRASGSETTTTDNSPAATVSIASPSNNVAIAIAAGNLDLSAELKAPLTEGELLVPYLDDEMLAAPQTRQVWTLTNLIRSPQALPVRRLLSTGGTVRESEMITIFVLRPSMLKATPK